jgi:hypothetical protein
VVIERIVGRGGLAVILYILAMSSDVSWVGGCDFKRIGRVLGKQHIMEIIKKVVKK